MTKNQLLTALTAWKLQIDRSNQVVEAIIDPLMLSPESPIYAVIWELQGALTRAVAKSVGDEFGWLDWFSAENGMGKRAGECCPGTGKPTRKIKTLKDLAWLIQESA